MVMESYIWGRTSICQMYNFNFFLVINWCLVESKWFGSMHVDLLDFRFLFSADAVSQAGFKVFVKWT